MKTKIIYICGGESCDISDIRSAFNQVKSTLGLDKETILFGVPIDTEVRELNLNNKQDLEEENFVDSIIEQETNKTEEYDIEETDENEKVIPILSVLSARNNGLEEDNIVTQVLEEKDETIIEEIVTEDDKTKDEIKIENLSVSEEERFYEDIEEENPPKSLQELFKKIPNLDEFVDEDLIREDNITIDIDLKNHNIEEESVSNPSLEVLVKEYMQKQKEIVNSSKNESGKLKNILGFKKAKKKSENFIGDLFGWAGIAANDEGYARPDISAKK